MDVDAAAAADVKQEQRSATPPKPLHPKIKLKMSGGTGRHTPPPQAVAAVAGAAGGPTGDGVPQEHRHQGGNVGPDAAPVSPSLPAAGPQEQQQPMLAAVEAVSAPAAAAAGPASPVLGAAAAPADSMAAGAPAAICGAPAAGEEGSAQ
jgi:hypothetical protein